MESGSRKMEERTGRTLPGGHASEHNPGEVKQFLRMVAAALLVTICSACATMGARNTSMTVMTYNIHHGEGLDGKLDLERIAKIIRAHNPDVVALQEVDDRATRSGKVAQAEELGKLTGMHHVFGKAMDFQGGGYGQAILSRWPIKKHQVHPLPQRPGREPRIALKAQIDAPELEFWFASVHLDHEIEAVRLEQAAEVNRIFARQAEGDLKLLAGDFNAVPGSGTMKSLLGAWLDTAGDKAGFTIPAANPRRRIDYILAAPINRCILVDSVVPEEPDASDHRPVVARVRVTQ